MQKNNSRRRLKGSLTLTRGRLASSRAEDLSLRQRTADSEVKMDALNGRVLSIMQTEAGPEEGYISVQKIRHLFNITNGEAQEVVLGLRNKGLIVKTNGKSNETYYLAPRGVAFLNGNGHKPGNRSQRIASMSVGELQERLKILERGVGSIGTTITDPVARLSAIRKLEKLIALKKAGKI